MLLAHRPPGGPAGRDRPGDGGGGDGLPPPGSVRLHVLYHPAGEAGGGEAGGGDAHQQRRLRLSGPGGGDGDHPADPDGGPERPGPDGGDQSGHPLYAGRRAHPQHVLHRLLLPNAPDDGVRRQQGVRVLLHRGPQRGTAAEGHHGHGGVPRSHEDGVSGCGQHHRPLPGLRVPALL